MAAGRRAGWKLGLQAGWGPVRGAERRRATAQQREEDTRHAPDSA